MPVRMVGLLDTLCPSQNIYLIGLYCFRKVVPKVLKPQVGKREANISQEGTASLWTVTWNNRVACVIGSRFNESSLVGLWYVQDVYIRGRKIRVYVVTECGCSCQSGIGIVRVFWST